jgi:hypothetical protein
MISPMIEKLLERALSAKKESKYIDFKAEFNSDSRRDLCELIKDIIAMANSGGGVILIGVKDDGTESSFDTQAVIGIDPAKITDQIAKFTGEQFSDFELRDVIRKDQQVVALLVSGVAVPMVFTEPGTYTLPDGKQQRTAFGRGTIYFRHGAKSDPGNTNDLRNAIEGELSRIRKSWLGNIKQVVEAPAGYKVKVLSPHAVMSTDDQAISIRLVDDTNAPTYRLESIDKTHPHRQKEVVQLVREKFDGSKNINSHDFFCVRKVYGIDESKPFYYHKPKYSSPQYSDEFVAWLIKSYEQNPSFFDEAKEKHKRGDYLK